MKATLSWRIVIAVVFVVLALAVTALAAASTSAAPAPARATRTVDDRQQAPIARDFTAVTRDTTWQLSSTLPLHFQTYHPEGLAVTPQHIVLSAVQVIVPPRMYPTPRGGYDRTPGKGVGHVFVMDHQGHLQRDIILGEGTMYHPGGMDFDGTSVWVPVAQYRPNSSAIIYRINAKSLAVHRQFAVNDHIGGIIRDPTTGHLVGNNWGSRRFYEWTLQGGKIAAWANPGYFIDYQDCQHLADRMMICGGIAELPQTAAAGGTGATYELGGIALINLRTHSTVHEVPFQKWSPAGHVATRNPFKISASGDQLTVRVAPDNGDENNGTSILTYRATVSSR